MAKLFVMLGLPGSGKSYEANLLAKKENAEIYSSDSFRLKMNLNAESSKQNNDLFDLMYKQIRLELDSGNNIILDATNTYYKFRLKLYKELAGCEAKKICVFVLRKYENCLIANRNRENYIDENVITKFYKEFDVPYIDEPFDEIILKYTDNDNNTLGSLTGNIEKDIKTIYENNKDYDLLNDDEQNLFKNICSYNCLFYQYDDEKYKMNLAYLIAKGQ